eukprot:2866609-Pleurochrysis_carterae.AAC.2
MSVYVVLIRQSAWASEMLLCLVYAFSWPCCFNLGRPPPLLVGSRQLSAVSSHQQSARCDPYERARPTADH